MASRAPVRWFWRDMRLVFALLVVAVFGVGLFAYFDSGIALRGATLVPPTPPQAAADELFTGAVVVVPPQGDRCWQMMLDNRTGRMWDGGYLDCDSLTGTPANNKRTGAVRAVRLNAIGASFRGD